MRLQEVADCWRFPFIGLIPHSVLPHRQTRPVTRSQATKTLPDYEAILNQSPSPCPTPHPAEQRKKMTQLLKLCRSVKTGGGLRDDFTIAAKASSIDSVAKV